MIQFEENKVSGSHQSQDTKWISIARRWDTFFAKKIQGDKEIQREEGGLQQTALFCFCSRNQGYRQVNGDGRNGVFYLTQTLTRKLHPGSGLADLSLRPHRDLPCRSAYADVSGTFFSRGNILLCTIHNVSCMTCKKRCLKGYTWHMMYEDDITHSTSCTIMCDDTSIMQMEYCTLFYAASYPAHLIIWISKIPGHFLAVSNRLSSDSIWPSVAIFHSVY